MSNVIEIYDVNRYPCHFQSGTWDYDVEYGYDLLDLIRWSEEHDDCTSKLALSLLLTGTLNEYGWLLDCAKRLEASSVVDIGCGHAQQSVMFENSRISYLGLEVNDGIPFYSGSTSADFMYGSWPEISPHADMAISSCCLGTGCAWEPEKLCEEYPMFAGNCQVIFFDELSRLYPHCEIIAYADQNGRGVLFPGEEPPEPLMIAMCWR